MASSHPKPFRYEPLSSEKPQIRLLKPAVISDSRESGLEEGHRQHWQLTVFDLENAPQYHALSYTWGCPYGKEELQSSNYGSVEWDSPFSDIFVNDQPFSVRNNLYYFFESFQFEKAAGNLWIDAICIDQSCHVERGKQVRNMREVYIKATSVIIWLGPADSGTDMVFDILDTAPQNLPSYKTTVFPIPEADRHHVPIVSRLAEELQFLFLESLRNLCSRSYWERVWIIQEILLATSLRVKCGRREAPWTIFASLFIEVMASYSFVNDEDPLPYNGNLAWFIASRKENSSGKGNSSKTGDLGNLGTLLRVSETSHCSKICDRIYGILGLVLDGDKFEVDDRIDSGTLYLRVVAFFPHRDIFSFCSQVARILRLPTDRLLPTFPKVDISNHLITERENFLLDIPLVHVGTIDTDGLKMSQKYATSSFDKVPYQSEAIPCHLCEATECHDIVAPEVSLGAFQIENTELLLAFSNTCPAEFVAIGRRYNTYLGRDVTVSFHRVGVAFPSLTSNCQFEYGLHSSRPQECSCSIKIGFSTFEFLMSWTFAYPGPEAGYQTNKWRKWSLDSNHTLCESIRAGYELRTQKSIMGTMTSSDASMDLLPMLSC